jgi:hypothetical protein
MSSLSAPHGRSRMNDRDLASKLQSYRPHRNRGADMARRTTRWRKPPPKVLSLPMSQRTELCYAFEGKAEHHYPLSGERAELLLIDQERHTRWVKAWHLINCPEDPRLDEEDATEIVKPPLGSSVAQKIRPELAEPRAGRPRLDTHARISASTAIHGIFVIRA